MLDLLIITGASRGIGASVAAECSKLCRTLIAIGSSEAIHNVRVTNSDCLVIPLRLDLSDFQTIHDSVRAATAEIVPAKNIGIVLCAAQLGEHGGLFQSDLNDWQKLYRCNVLGNLAVVKACAPRIENGAKLRVVFFAGGGAAYGYPEFSGYALSKVAVVRAVENLAMELAVKGADASVIALAPGAVATDMLAKVVAHGGVVNTRTDIGEPTTFVRRFLDDEFDSSGLNGRFLHVRDAIDGVNFSTAGNNLFKLRRIE